MGSLHERARRKAPAENFQAPAVPVAERYDWSDTRCNRTRMALISSNLLRQSTSRRGNGEAMPCNDMLRICNSPRSCGGAKKSDGNARQELHWNSKAKKGCGYALHREAMDTRGDDTAKPSYARLRYAMKSKARHRRSVDGTGSGTAKKRCDVQRR